MSESRQFEGRSPAEAVINACEALGLTRSEVKYEVISDVGEGFGRRVSIRVEATPRPASAARDEERTEAPRMHSESRGPAMSPRPSGRRDSGDRGNRRDSGDRGNRRESGDRGHRRGPRRDDRERADSNNDGIEALLGLDSGPQQPFTHREEVTSPLSERAAQAKEHATVMTRLMGLKVAARVVQDDGQEIHIDLVGEDEMRVIGAKGDVLLSLQFLINRMVGRHTESEELVVLDAAGYRDRRKNALAELARRLAKRAREENKAVRLSPMSAHDRRIFHITLKEMEGVTTRSEGDGLYRRLLIIPSEFT